MIAAKGSDKLGITEPINFAKDFYTRMDNSLDQIRTEENIM